MAEKILPIDGYDDFLNSLKERIRNAQVRAALSVNRELVLLYWQIGNEILTRQQQQGWGAKVIDKLASDLRKTFPDMKGFSARNFKYMRAFAEAYPNEQFVQEVLAQIRKALVTTKSTIKNQLGKSVNNPTMRWIFQCFQSIHLVKIDNQILISNWNSQREYILSLLPDNCRYYYQC